MLLAPPLPLGLALLYKAAAGAGAVALAYGWPGARVFGRLGGWFLALNLLLTGAGSPGAGRPRRQSHRLSGYHPGAAAGGDGGGVSGGAGADEPAGRPGRAAVPAWLELGGAKIPVEAFYDSGFTLADPVAGRPVVLVQYGAVRGALPQAWRDGLDAALEGTGGLPDPALGLRYLVCGTIAGRTLLPAVPADALCRQAGGRSWRAEGLLAAFCPGGAGEGWTLLLGSDLAGRMGLS